MAGGRLHVRVGEVQLRRWRGEAAREGIPFSEWVRRRLDGDGPVAASASSDAAVGSPEGRALVADGFAQDDGPVEEF
jgi:hypothetical protein